MTENYFLTILHPCNGLDPLLLFYINMYAKSKKQNLHNNIHSKVRKCQNYGIFNDSLDLASLHLNTVKESLPTWI